MNIDFLKEGSDDCPIIRLYNGQYEDYDRLIYSITNLINDGIKFDVLQLEGFRHDSTINSLIIEIDIENKGVLEDGEGIFRCYWPQSLLLKIIEKINIYQKDHHGYFWLDDDSEGIDVLLSYSGRW